SALAISGGHWLIWMCCGPLGTLSHPERLVEFQAFALTPPATLSLLAFHGKELEDLGTEETGYILPFSLLGIVLYAVGSVVLYALGNARFPAATQRRREVPKQGPPVAAPVAAPSPSGSRPDAHQVRAFVRSSHAGFIDSERTPPDTCS